MNIKLYPPLTVFEIGKRGNQEDFICPVEGLATADDRLFIVCDGMGGHEHGEVASKTFATALRDYFAAHIDPSAVLQDSQLADAIASAYAALDAVDDGNYKKMGTTLTLLYLHRGGVTAAHIGDSRIYHIRPKVGPLYVSRDHSLVFDLYQSGEITYDEMRTHSSKNIITRAVQPGADNRVKPDIIHITDIEPGDWFYLCSDGMLEQMDDDELARLLTADVSDEKKRQQLINATLNNKDNHSAYLLHVKNVNREEGDKLLACNEEETARCNALNIRPVILPAVNNDVEMLGDSDTENGNVVESTANDNAVEDAMMPQTPPPYRSQTYDERHPRGYNKWLLLLAAIMVAALVGYLIFGRGSSEQHKKVDLVNPVNQVNPPKPIQSPNQGVPAGVDPSGRVTITPGAGATARPSATTGVDPSVDQTDEPNENTSEQPQGAPKSSNKIKSMVRPIQEKSSSQEQKSSNQPTSKPSLNQVAPQSPSQNPPKGPVTDPDFHDA